MEIFIKVLVNARRIGQCRRATRAPDGDLPGIKRVTVNSSHPLILLWLSLPEPKALNSLLNCYF